ncbi:MAG: hypothetical protein MUC96_23300 [Myxococcaceae bacterium]|jgi:hypothetical protein|nr:hypothetical protein [Myxococcaceae bacterium]
MKRLVHVALLALTAGCATVVPMQTASVVERGRFRAGGSLSAAGYCGDPSGGLLLGMTRCTEYPDGIPLPELRANARYGLGAGFDVGLSAQAQGQLIAPERIFQFGLTADVKGELLRIPTDGPTHIVSTGLLGGAALSGRFGLPLWAQLEWGVPLFYGLQFSRWEVVVGASVSQRLLLPRFATSSLPPVDSVRAGLTLGLFRRNPASWALQLSYLSDPARFSTGTIQLQFGWFFDLG